MNKLLFEELEFQGHDAVILEITLPLLSGRLTTFTPWLACRPSVLIREARSQNPRGVIRWLAFRVFAILPSSLLLTQLLTRHSTRGIERGRTPVIPPRGWWLSYRNDLGRLKWFRKGGKPLCPQGDPPLSNARLHNRRGI